MGYSRQSDKTLLEQLRVLEVKLTEEGESADLLYQMGKLHFGLHDATAAIASFEQALTLDPESTDIQACLC